MVSRRKKLDEVLTEYIGGYGRYQIVMTLVILSSSFLSAFDTIPLNFLTYTPDFACVSQLRESNNDSLADVNRSLIAVYNETCYWTPESNSSADDVTEVKCDAWVYDDSVRSSSIVTQFDLVCDKKVLVAMTKMIYVISFVVGAWLGGFTSDRYGRRFACLWSLYLKIIFRLMNAFSVNWLMFAITLFLVGVSTSVACCSGYILACEIVSAKYRSWIGSLFGLTWCTGFMLVPAVAYLIKAGRELNLVFTALHAPTILLVFIIPESPRWLEAMGRMVEADKVLQKIAYWNRREMPQTDLELDDNYDEDETDEVIAKDERCLDLVKSRTILLSSLVMYLVWFSVAMLYYGLILNVENMAGDLYFNVFLSGLVEVPAYLLSFVGLYSVLGRKWTTCGSLVIAGICMLSMMAVPPEHAMIATVLSMVGKGFNTLAFIAINVYTPELYPTTVRTSGLGMASMMARFGSMIAPFVAQMGGLAGIVFGAFSLLSGLLVLLLPETRNKPLPQTIAEAIKLRS